jgi:hypothetical protein
MEPDPNHGKARIRTSESLNEAYMMWVPSGDPHSASGEDRMSSVKECVSIKTAPFAVKCDVSDHVLMQVCMWERNKFTRAPFYFFLCSSSLEVDFLKT